MRSSMPPFATRPPSHRPESVIRHFRGSRTRAAEGFFRSRTRLWKAALQELADKLGLRLEVSHFPPGTRKWNKIEQRMFCHITPNWRGRPRVSYAVIVQLIGSTKTDRGLRIRAEVDENEYPTKETVTAQQLARVPLRPAACHGEWNYAILPH